MTGDEYTLQTLKDARALISDKSNWGQGAFESHDGRYCAMGAVYAVEEKLHLEAPTRPVYDPALWLRKVVHKWGGYGHSVTAFNDDNSHRKVLKMFDEAIHNLQLHITNTKMREAREAEETRQREAVKMLDSHDGELKA
jgi:hypothetical protein